MSVTNSQRPDETLLNYHPLTTRAVELQTRLEVFKRDFNLFYARALRSYGKWHTVELVYVKQSAETTQCLISSIRMGQAPVLSLKTTI